MDTHEEQQLAWSLFQWGVTASLHGPVGGEDAAHVLTARPTEASGQWVGGCCPGTPGDSVTQPYIFPASILHSYLALVLAVPRAGFSSQSCFLSCHCLHSSESA